MDESFSDCLGSGKADNYRPPSMCAFLKFAQAPCSALQRYLHLLVIISLRREVTGAGPLHP